MRSITFSLLLISLLGTASATAAEPPKNPRSVADCVLSLPDSFAGNVSRAARKKGIENAIAGQKGQILDEKNGYLYISKDEGKGAYHISAALFPTSHGKTILGINPIYFSPYPEFYQWTGTQWAKVTNEVLPPKLFPKFGFSLPRHGTTINVHEVIMGEPLDTKDEIAFKIKWTGEKFVRER